MKIKRSTKYISSTTQSVLRRIKESEEGVQDLPRTFKRLSSKETKMSASVEVTRTRALIRCPD